MMNLLIEFGLPWKIRTPDLWFRRPALYPAELKAVVNVSPDPIRKMKGKMDLENFEALTIIFKVFAIFVIVKTYSISDNFFFSHL